jgi:3',5'-nucleoside bisphosphate phosphatase
MLIELHSHTSEHSLCSKIHAVDLVSLVRAAGIDGVVLTDHHYLWADNDLEILRERAGVKENFLILSGQEVFTSDFGDILVYGADQSFRQGILLSAVRQAAPHAAIIWAHPYRGYLPTEIELFAADLDGIEIINTHHRLHENEQAINDWRTWGNTATSGTDIHQADIATFYPTKFDVTISSIDDLVAALRNGRCLPELDGFSSKVKLG